MSEWSPEPWHGEIKSVAGTQSDGQPASADWLEIHSLAEFVCYLPEEGHHNGNRILACVNALAGIADPAALVESHAELLKCLRGFWEELKQAPRIKCRREDVATIDAVITRAEAARGKR